MTKRLEIIHARLAGDSPERLVAAIRRSIAAQTEVASVRIYRSATVPTDLGIHVCFQPGKGDFRPSELGVHLAAALREHGLVEHTMWVEVEQESEI